MKPVKPYKAKVYRKPKSKPKPVIKTRAKTASEEMAEIEAGIVVPPADKSPPVQLTHLTWWGKTKRRWSQWLYNTPL
jgi:hypothetical protein